MKKIFLLSFLVASIAATAQPIIGVSANDSDMTASVSMTYVNAIRNAGGVPVLIPWTTDKVQLEKIFNTIDGLVMTGGEDIDPLKYYGEEPHRGMGKIVPRRDASDYIFIKMAVEKGIPVLGICRGEQMMNVVFGGNLYQDIPSQKKDSYVDHSQSAPKCYGTHSIDIDKQSLLYKILGTEIIVVNSLHHQAVKNIAPGFKVTAVSKDGVVEAIEKTDSKRVLGVQFHPEGFASEGGETPFLNIFKWLVEESSK